MLDYIGYSGLYKFTHALKKCCSRRFFFRNFSLEIYSLNLFRLYNMYISYRTNFLEKNKKIMNLSILI